MGTWRENGFANNPRETESTACLSTSEYYSGATEVAIRVMLFARSRTFASLCVIIVPAGMSLETLATGDDGCIESEMGGEEIGVGSKYPIEGL